MEKQMNIVHIDAFDINDAWFQCIRKCVEVGHDYKISRGSYKSQRRKEFDLVTIAIRNPANRPLRIQIPEGSPLPPPNDDDYISDYFANYIMSDAISEDEDYTYGERLTGFKVRGLERTLGRNIRELKLDAEKEKKLLEAMKTIPFKARVEDEQSLNSIEEVINMYVNSGFLTNQATMEVGMPSDILLLDPPCLRMIDTRIRHGKLHFIVYFRSWDLIGGFPTNLAGLQLLKEYMVGEINERMNDKYEGIFKPNDDAGLKDGELLAVSKGLHIYDHQWEYANMRLGKTG
jgi:thymidylate synthase